jgi:hypothetical protein
MGFVKYTSKRPQKDRRERQGNKQEGEASTQMGSTCRRHQGSYEAAALTGTRGTSANGMRGTTRKGRQDAQPTGSRAAREGKKTKTIRTGSDRLNSHH